MLEFQVLSVALEDRYPPALPSGLSREDVLEDNFHHFVKQERVEKKKAGCVAFVFGRAEDGRSVCTRVEGVRPCLFFALEPGETPGALKRELTAEMSERLKHGDTIFVSQKQFAHFYDFEPDPTSPSGRLVHEYAEARYTSLAGWRHARALRREDEDSPPDPAIRTAHEGQVDPHTQFLVENGIKPGAWVRVTGQPVDNRMTTCDVECEADVGTFAALPDKNLDSPYVVCYYDIETIGLQPEEGSCIQISLVFRKQGHPVAKHVVAVGTVDPIEGAVVHSVQSEGAALRKTRQIIIENDPDWLVTYNGTTFDNNYLAVRAMKGMAVREGVADFFYLGRYALRPSRLRELNLSSDGMGDNLLKYFDTAGRINLDFLVILRREHTSEVSYRLEHFANKFCGDEKEPMDYREIPKLQAGTSADRARLASYCVPR